MKRQLRTKVLVGTSAMLMLASPAVAGSCHDAWNTGSGTYNGGAPSGDYHRRVNVADRSSDSRSVHGNYHWSNGQGGSLPNSSRVEPDTCTGWQ